jgi:hypothetical protein
VLALNGRSTVNSSLEQEKIVGTPDMTPAAIKAEAEQAGLEDVDLPTCSVAGEPVDDGDGAASRNTCASTRSSRRVA